MKLHELLVEINPRYFSPIMPEELGECLVGVVSYVSRVPEDVLWCGRHAAQKPERVHKPNLGDEDSQIYPGEAVGSQPYHGSDVEDVVTGLIAPGPIAVDVAGGKLYWADTGGKRIQRANLDGSNVDTLVTVVETVYGIAVDPAAGKIYWTGLKPERIRRANLDGSNVEELLTIGLYPYGLALDQTAGKMYWTDGGISKIQRANLDGSNV